MTQLSHHYHHSKPQFSLPSIIAIVAAIGSFFAHAGLALFLAIVAMIAGVIGILVSLSPSVRGGMVSMLAIVAGVLAFVLGIIKLVF